VKEEIRKDENNKNNTKCNEINFSIFVQKYTYNDDIVNKSYFYKFLYYLRKCLCLSRIVKTKNFLKYAFSSISKKFDLKTNIYLFYPKLMKQIVFDRGDLFTNYEKSHFLIKIQKWVVYFLKILFNFFLIIILNYLLIYFELFSIFFIFIILANETLFTIWTINSNNDTDENNTDEENELEDKKICIKRW
jgi:hypothetical protein